MNTKRLLWWLLAGTRGGSNRARIISTLHERPFNAHQLAQHLDLDYKTIRHHLDLLVEHGIVASQGEGYGTVYLLTEEMENAYDQFSEIWQKMERGSSKVLIKGEVGMNG